MQLEQHFRFADLDPYGERWLAINKYNASILDRLPPGAKEFVSSQWHYAADDPRCPHDSWLKSIEFKFAGETKERVEAVRMCLLGAYHDRDIYLDYTGLSDFSVEGQLAFGDRNLNWLYDEVHLLDSGLVEHIIRFESSAIRVECADLKFSWITFSAPYSP